LFISREKLPPTQVDEYYLCDLFGLDVVAAADGRLIGKVLAAQDYGAGTFLEIMFLDNGKIGTLPFHRESVMAVNLAAKRITIIEKFLIH
jgi:ribosomal 30S subunit maturation factor RimM